MQSEWYAVSLAYIDPGSGTLLIQFVVAGLIGGAVYLRQQLVGLFSWMKHKTFSRKS